jgi:hypothetical protein
VKEWKEKECKAMRKRAKRVKAEIYWGDETAVKAGGARVCARGEEAGGKPDRKKRECKYDFGGNESGESTLESV